MTDDAPANAFVIPPGYRQTNWMRGFGRSIGPLYEKHDGKGAYTRAFLVEEHHTNGMMNAHGGMLMSFADMAFGSAVSVQRSSYWVTVRLVCDFLSGAKMGDWIEGNGEIIGVDADLFTVKGRVWCADRTILTGSGIFKAIKPRDPRPGELAYRD